MANLTPQQIVTELDRFIIGQPDAKRAVAVAIRNRWRRRQLSEEMRREVYPKNIVMIGPTGVGKTEIARRLAHLTGAPFVKVEASKYTEVGYHGRDVESMVRDLLDQAIAMVRREQAEQVREKAREAAMDRVVDHLLPGSSDGRPTAGYVDSSEAQQRREHARERLHEQVSSGQLDERMIDITITQRPATNVMFANMGLDQMDPEMTNVFEKLIPEQTRHRKASVRDAIRIFEEEETEKLLDKEKITAEAITRAQEEGIIFVDEIDKITVSSDGAHGPDVSRQGVQRDLLPIVEGSAVTTRHGVVHTDHVLFIAAGAFHSSSVSDLMPELQGRFPLRVELSALTREDFVRILTEPSSALTKQQHALLGVEGIDVVFDEGSIEAMADLAAQANASLENIGARRLMTIVERVFEQLNFDAPDLVARGEKQVHITESFVREQVAPILKDQDLSKFVL